MSINKNSVVSLQYEMYNTRNELIDKTTDHDLTYLHGGYDNIFPLVEEKLHGQEVGYTIDIHLEPEDAFGEIDNSLILLEDESSFPEKPEVGMQFETDDPQTGETLVFRVVQVADGKVVIDANHPFAGEKIRFKATVTDIREATPDEIAHGHTHQHEH